jgi:hypothetical protein
MAPNSLCPTVTHHEYIEVAASNALNATFLDASAAIAAEVVKVCRERIPCLSDHHTLWRTRIPNLHHVAKEFLGNTNDGFESLDCIA